MLISMTIRKRVWIAFSVILSVFLLGSCGNIIPTPTVTVTVVPSLTSSALSITPSPIPSSTPTPDFCSSSQWQDHMRILSDDLLTALEPGGPTIFDRILVEQNPAWADFRQYDHGELRSAGIIFHETAFGPEWGTGINPAVILVTYGVERNWELPANGDLVSEVENIRAALFQYRSEWVHGQVDQTQYPIVANGATYVLYRYFNGDLLKLETWCRTYVQVF
jgi:hypothetical protein